MNERMISDARVLVVDDDNINICLLRGILAKAGYLQVRATTNSCEVLAIFEEFQPDVVLLDLHMPRLDGFGVMEQLESVIEPGTYLPILVLTADTSTATRAQALASGAKDFVTKPFNAFEVKLRIQNLLETRFLHQRLKAQNSRLESVLGQRSEELEESHLEVLERLSLAAELRDDNFGEHTQRVGTIAAQLADMVGMPFDLVRMIRRAAPLHDIGKIGIADAILLKPGQLDRSEVEIMKTHTSIGGRILSGGRSPLLQCAEQISLTHHEHWDGAGYPHGLVGTDIPLSGRLVAVADVFDALTHNRPYKAAWRSDDAAVELDRLSGSQLDPNLVSAFQELLREGEVHFPH